MNRDYDGFRIFDIHAICVIGEDNEEGVPAFVAGDVVMPLIAADPKRLSQIKDMAQVIANETGKTLKVCRFSVREEIGEITPDGT